MKRIIGIVIGMALPFTAMAAQTSPGPGSFTAGKDYVEGEVLVAPSQSGAMWSAMGQGYVVAASSQGRTPFIKLKLKPGQSVASAMNALSVQPWVGQVQPNYIYHATLLPTDPRFGDQWGYQNTGQSVNGTAGTSGADIGAVAAWDEYSNCSGVTVAVIDTGVDYNHQDLYGNIWANTGEVINGIDDDGNGFIDDVQGWDFVQGDNDPMDFNEHGTHVAGTIGATGNNGIGGTGVCLSSSIMPVRALNSSGSGTTADIVSAIDYAVANGAKVINMSLGGPSGFTGDLMYSAILNADAYGALVVAAAGNSGTNNDTTSQYPASYNLPNIISVAATDQNDALASFSNFGATSVDMAAPGTNILSSVPPARTAVAGCSWNFDAGLGGWTVGTYDNYGAVVNPNTVGVTSEAAFSVPNSLTDSPGGNYANNRSYRAQSPAGCNLSGVTGARLDYMLKADTEIYADWIYAEASVDGVNWTSYIAGSGSTGGLWYALNQDMQILDGYATAYIRARFDTDFSITYDGFHIDDVAITRPNTSPAAHSATDYAFLNGTSMATPHVAGAAALVWAADPALTSAALKSRLMNNGDSLAVLAGKTVSGRRLNVQMAMPLHTPTGVSATAVANNRIDVAWTDNSVSENGYKVLRDDSGTGVGTYSVIATLPANTTTYSDSTAPQGVVPSYKVWATAVDGRAAATLVGVAATDLVKPVITLLGSNPMYVLVNSTFTDPGSVVSDNFDTGLVATTGGVVDTYTLGSYPITYDVTDTSGNAAVQVVRTVNVVTSLPVPPVAAAGGGGGGCVLNTGAGFDSLFVLLLLSAAISLVRGRRRNGMAVSGV